jgi:hypothetical protein
MLSLLRIARRYADVLRMCARCPDDLAELREVEKTIRVTEEELARDARAEGILAENEIDAELDPIGVASDPRSPSG